MNEPAVFLSGSAARFDYGPLIARAVAADEADAAQTPAYVWRGPTPEEPDWRGIRRDTGYFLGYQFAVIGILYFAPEDVSGWSDEDKEEYSFDKWWDNVSDPVVRDGDVWWINYITHPYWGGTYYIRARERGLNRTQSFWYSALLSTLYEYGAEALFEPVSVEDLLVTPLLGSLVGEYLFTPLREKVRAKPGALDWSDKTILVLTDPLGVLNAGTDRLFGVKTTLELQPIGTRLQALPGGSENTGAVSPMNCCKSAGAWGLELRIDW